MVRAVVLQAATAVGTSVADRSTGRPEDERVLFATLTPASARERLGRNRTLGEPDDSAERASLAQGSSRFRDIRNGDSYMNQMRGSVVKALDRLMVAQAYLTSYCRGRKNRKLFDGVRKYCMFIGYPRSGHSLIGSLLDAHSNAIIAHELDALKFIGAGCDKNQLYQLLLDNSRR